MEKGLSTKKTIKVEDFMGEEEEETTLETKKEPGKSLDLAFLVSEFILK